MHYPSLAETRNGLYTRHRVRATQSLNCIPFGAGIFLLINIAAAAASIVFAGRARHHRSCGCGWGRGRLRSCVCVCVCKKRLGLWAAIGCVCVPRLHAWCRPVPGSCAMCKQRFGVNWKGRAVLCLWRLWWWWDVAYIAPAARVLLGPAAGDGRPLYARVSTLRRPWWSCVLAGRTEVEGATLPHCSLLTFSCTYTRHNLVTATLLYTIHRTWTDERCYIIWVYIVILISHIHCTSMIYGIYISIYCVYFIRRW